MSNLNHYAGLNSENEQIVVLSEASLANAATTDTTLPEKYRKGGWTPVVLGAATTTAAAPGARTITGVAPGTAAFGVTLVEDTGVLTVTNNTGGTLTRVMIVVLLVGTSNDFS